MCELPLNDGRVLVTVMVGGKALRTITRKCRLATVKRHLLIAAKRMGMN